MLPSKEDKLKIIPEFRSLVLSAMTRVMKVKCDELTVSGTVTNLADQKVLDWIREKSITGSIQDHKSSRLIADPKYVGAILSMFDDTTSDDIEYIEDTATNIEVNLDLTKPIIMNKVIDNNYLYMLAGATPEDFEKTLFEGGIWIKPTT